MEERLTPVTCDTCGTREYLKLPTEGLEFTCYRCVEAELSISESEIQEWLREPLEYDDSEETPWNL